MVLEPYGLTCEYRTAPLGIDETQPRLGWKLRSDESGQAQTAYRVMVTTAATVLSPSALAWDSGWKASEKTNGVGYDGAPLQSGTRYEWRVRVRGRDGQDGGSASSWWETAMLHADEWHAQWIERDPRCLPKADPPAASERTLRTGRLAPPPHFRRVFELDGRPWRARLYATAHGIYRLALNGARVGTEELSPGWTDYRHRVLYQTYDVTNLLVDGQNALSAVVADGWWSGYLGPDPFHQGNLYGTAPQLLAQLVMDFADGRRRVVATDGQWREAAGGLAYADLLMGELHDARQDLKGFDLAGFDDSGWNPVLVSGPPTGTVAASCDEAVRVSEIRPAQTLTEVPGGWLADFGQNLVGRVRLTLRDAPPGTEIVIRHGEVLDRGALYTENLRTAEATDRWVTAGGAFEEVSFAFTIHGFRYAEITGCPVGLSAGDVAAEVLHSDVDWVGDMTCSDPEVNQLISNIRWGQRGNFVSVPTDCPQRDERLGWLADAQVFAPTACMNADLSAFFARWLTDVVASQDAEGAFADVAPAVVVSGEAAPGWGDAGVLLPWLLYRVYGDRRLLQRCFPAMQAWVDHIHRNNPGLLWTEATGASYGDWLEVDAATPRTVVATAYFARSAQVLAQAAVALGDRASADRYGTLAVAVADAFTAAFLDPDGAIRGKTQTGGLLALAWGLLPAEAEPGALRQVVADIERRSNRLSTGFLGVSLLCQVLSDHGRADVAYALLHQDRYPSWNYSIRHGATTIWERWDGWTEEGGFASPAMNSFNHYALGSIGEWLYRTVAGIGQSAASVGYDEIVIAPVPGGRVWWASGGYESIRGRVAVRWELNGRGLVLDVEIPPGRPAVVRLPVRPAEVAVIDAEPVRGQRSGGSLTLSVPSGRHRVQLLTEPC
jgi:alpha-L-rhamnosidase